MDYKNISYKLLSNIENDYKKFEKLFSITGVSRGRKLSYSLACEKAITQMVIELLKDKNYTYNTDKIFSNKFAKNMDKSILKNNKWQPDLIITDKDGNVVMVIEIKYQIGYWNYEKDFERLKDYENYNIIFVNFLVGNHSKKVNKVINKFNGKIKFYTLYNKSVDYKNISVSNKDDIFDDKEHGFIAFIKKIESLK